MWKTLSWYFCCGLMVLCVSMCLVFMNRSPTTADSPWSPPTRISCPCSARFFCRAANALGPWPLLPGRGPVRPDVEQKAGSDDGRRFGGWCLYGGISAVVSICQICVLKLPLPWLSSELATSIASLCWITFQQRYMYCDVICPQEECTDGEELRWNPST